MNRRAASAIAVLFLFVTGCQSPSAVEGECALLVQIDGRSYELADPATHPVPGDFDPGEPYATVTRHDPDCVDVAVNGEIPDASLEDGASTFLPEGTPLYAMDGLAPTERLAVRWNDDWVSVAAK